MLVGRLAVPCTRGPTLALPTPPRLICRSDCDDGYRCRCRKKAEIGPLLGGWYFSSIFGAEDRRVRFFNLQIRRWEEPPIFDLRVQASLFERQRSSSAAPCRRPWTRPADTAAYVYAYMCICICVCIYIYTYIYVYLFIHTYICTYTPIYYMYIYIYILNIYIYI